MLLQFRIKNVKSFREEAILDFTASGISEHTNHVFERNGNRVLPLVAIYGANASGKTNIVSALQNMCDFVRTSVDSNDESLNKFRFVFAPFIFNRTISPAEFEVTVSLDCDYKYGFTIDYNTVVLSEYLEYRKKTNGAFFTIFERSKNKPLKITKASVIGNEERKHISFISSITGDNELLLTMLGRRRGSSATISLSRYAKLFDWLSSVAECPECYNSKLEILTGSKNPELKRLFSDGKAVDDYIKFIQRADPTITTISIDKENESNPDKIKELEGTILTKRYFEHTNTSFELPTVLESSGTTYLMRAYPIIKQVLDNGGLLIADEIDRSLHPTLLLDIVNLFTDPETNPNHAQLLCTMHNVIIMDRRFLRRDEIWFVEKSHLGESTLYSLADYDDVRNDADFCKNYILGKYGAIPEKL